MPTPFCSPPRRNSEAKSGYVSRSTSRPELWCAVSLKSKPFVILAGTFGTGKTRLVRLFAEAIGATSANGRYCQVAVRSDSTDLFGHVDLNGNFVPGAILPFLKAAKGDKKHPYILCLDEMNLARVEYYMSDFLSIIESRGLKDGEIVSDLIMTNDKYGNDKEAVATYGEIGFPQNLYIVGTVNMDETTFPFSRKVLNRANTIEFNYVDLGLHFSEPIDAVKPYEADNSFLMSEYLVLNRDCREYFDVIRNLRRMKNWLRKCRLKNWRRLLRNEVRKRLNKRKSQQSSIPEIHTSLSLPRDC